MNGIRQFKSSILTVEARISCGQHPNKKDLQTLWSVNLTPCALESGPEKSITFISQDIWNQKVIVLHDIAFCNTVIFVPMSSNEMSMTMFKKHLFFFLENQLCNEHGYKYLSLVYENDFLTHQTLDFMCWSWSLCFFSPQLVAFITYSLTIPLTRTARGQFYFQKRKTEKKKYCFALPFLTGSLKKKNSYHTYGRSHRSASRAQYPSKLVHHVTH